MHNEEPFLNWCTKYLSGLQKNLDFSFLAFGGGKSWFQDRDFSEKPQTKPVFVRHLELNLDYFASNAWNKIG